ncbi:alanine racemase [Hamadaea sp. NPDC050747]|uniref:alanine racemase n=1 Tax=Hamadaea sp. NPDC050747 TaxID=3155789 RepID=UPI0033CC56C7
MIEQTARLVVDLTAVRANVRAVSAGTRAAVMAVVKADGFGHGAVPVARAALDAGATWLGVTSAAEALRLRQAGVDAPVLSWLHPIETDFEPLIRREVDLGVSTVAHLRRIAVAAEAAGRSARVHLKADTGLTRNGASADDWPDLVAWAAKLAAEGWLTVTGVWSHLAAADVPGDRTTDLQLAAFRDAVAAVHAAGLRPELRHVANSAATLTRPDTHFDLCRVGLALYGIEPVSGRRHGLRPAMTLTTSVINVKRAPAGTGVSYRHEYTVRRPSTLALLPVGYADGLPRTAEGRAHVWLAGQRCPIVGRITMDQCVVDAGGLPVAIGDPVTVFGPGDAGEPTAADWATWAGTNPHEILTGAGARAERQWVIA